MSQDDIMVIGAPQISKLLEGRETEIIDLVREVYLTHAEGNSFLPQSMFLRFPNNAENRIIALPAYLAGRFEIAGLKWISSFPRNHRIGLDRASAVVVLNSVTSGRPQVLMEGSLISAKRTAASAALAARVLSGPAESKTVGIVGCGLINFEILRFILADQPKIQRVMLFDLDSKRSTAFANRCGVICRSKQVQVLSQVDPLLRDCDMISLATTTLKPHLNDVSIFKRGATILNISLRDLSPEIIMASDNVVDDVEHVCRAGTSIHLTEQEQGSREFITCTLADVLLGKATRRSRPNRLTIFSPFGLGVLDIAMGSLVRSLAESEGAGVRVANFFPRPFDLSSDNALLYG